MDLFKGVRSGAGLLLLMSLLAMGLMIMLGGKLIDRRPIIQLVIPERSGSCKEQDEKRENSVSGLMKETTVPDNPALVRAIRENFLDPPSNRIAKMSLPLFKTAQAEAIDKILKQMKNGFFVECGGLDGERSSNTIFFEQKRNWTGLLIEMDPSWYMQLRGKNRKSFSINACISPQQYPIKMNFKEHGMGQGKLVLKTESSSTIHQVYCFPFYSMMLALNRTSIDYFSLDVEGFELEILKTIPFDKLDIKTFSVEYAHAKQAKMYVDFMLSKGYRLHSKVNKNKPEIYYGAMDYIFVKN